MLDPISHFALCLDSGWGTHKKGEAIQNRFVLFVKVKLNKLVSCHLHYFPLQNRSRQVECNHNERISSEAWSLLFLVPAPPYFTKEFFIKQSSHDMDRKEYHPNYPMLRTLKIRANHKQASHSISCGLHSAIRDVGSEFLKPSFQNSILSSWAFWQSDTSDGESIHLKQSMKPLNPILSLRK